MSAVNLATISMVDGSRMQIQDKQDGLYKGAYVGIDTPDGQSHISFTANVENIDKIIEGFKNIRKMVAI